MGRRQHDLYQINQISSTLSYPFHLYFIPIITIGDGVKKMGQGNSIFECMSDRDDRHNDLKSFRSKRVSGPTVHLINGVPHLSSPWPVSTDSSLHFSPSPEKFEEDTYIISPFDIMSPSLR